MHATRWVEVVRIRRRDDNDATLRRLDDIVAQCAGHGIEGERSRDQRLDKRQPAIIPPVVDA